MLATFVPWILAFALVSALAFAGPAAADDHCGGANLIRKLADEDPAALEAIREQAGSTPNGKGLLWKIETDASADSYLYGTMHVADERVTRLSPAAEAAFANAGTVVIETDEIVDPAKAQAAFLMRPELTMFTDGTTLESLMSDDEYALVREKLRERGLPIAAVSRMKPWMIAGLVSLPACELERKAQGEPFLDKLLAERALATGKELKGLETVAEQLEAMASLPLQFHVRGLIETLSLGPLLADVMATMTDLYVAGETGMILPMIRAATPESADGSATDYADFEERIIIERNRLMAKRAGPILEEGGAFIAVGALHLPGEEGLIELFREAGYRVTAAE